MTFSGFKLQTLRRGDDVWYIDTGSMVRWISDSGDASGSVVAEEVPSSPEDERDEAVEDKGDEQEGTCGMHASACDSGEIQRGVSVNCRL